MPLGQVPVLEIDGKKMLPQSMAIGRYLAKLTHTYGANDLEAAHIDAFVDLSSDIDLKIQHVVMAIFQKKDDQKVCSTAFALRSSPISGRGMDEGPRRRHQADWLLGERTEAERIWLVGRQIGL